MKERLIAIAGLFGTRFTNRQKGRFIRYIQNSAQQSGHKLVIDSATEKHRACRNLYLGSFKRAKVILAVPYDTPSRILWPGIRYYPLDAKKNAVQDSVAKALDFLLAALILGSTYLLLFRRFVPAGGAAGGLSILAMILAVLLSAKIIQGFGNRNNYTRNSASVAVALECLKQFEKDRVAIALLDDSCCGFGGYRQLAKYLKAEGLDKRVIALDCIAEGQELHLHSGEAMLGFDAQKLHLIAQDQRDQSAIGLFSDSAILTGGSRVDGETVVLGTRCSKDNQISLEKMQQAVDAIHPLSAMQSRACANNIRTERSNPHEN